MGHVSALPMSYFPVGGETWIRTKTSRFSCEVTTAYAVTSALTRVP